MMHQSSPTSVTFGATGGSGMSVANKNRIEWNKIKEDKIKNNEISEQKHKEKRQSESVFRW